MFRRFVRWLRQWIVPIMIVLFVGTLGAFFYVRAEALMASELRQRLVATATLAAQQFDAAEIVRVRSSDDAGSPAHRRLVKRLQDIRVAVPGVEYAYLVRRTDDPFTVAFVADADEFVDPAVLDIDGNGVVDDDEAPATTGDPYDVSELDEFRQGFDVPSVDREITHDQWGSFISGYAPVRDASGAVVAVLGIDMDAGDFLSITRSIFSPAALALVLAAGAMLAYFSFSVIQRRRFDALRQLDAERTALLNLATHQLGVPLTTFRWWLEILRDRQSDDPEDAEAIAQLQHGIDRMTAIIQSLQEASRLQAGDVTYRPEPTVLSAFIASLVEEMRPRFSFKHQDVSVQTDNDVPQVTVDRKILRAVLQELLENASSYSPNGAAIAVRVKRERSRVRIDVSDRGVGVPAGEQAGLFQKFARATNSYSVKPVGTGLGLFICKGLIERAGGTIRLKSKPGEGTTVSIVLPVAA